MEIYENLLSMEISRITQEHDAFLSNLLFDQDDDFHSENISLSGVHDKNANINHNIDMKWKTKRQKGKTGNKNRRSTSDIGEPAAIYMENNEKVRTCQDMNGVLGILLEIFYEIFIYLIIPSCMTEILTSKKIRSSFQVAQMLFIF